MPHNSLRRPRRAASLAALAAAALCAAVPAASQDGALAPERAVPVSGAFHGKGGGAATDLSGIACLPPGPGGTRECLIINDENKGAQRARLVGGTLEPGAAVPLLGKSPPNQALGSPPSLACPGEQDKFEDLDGEGVALAPGATPETGTFYVVGSHGCSRKKAEARLSSFLLARIPFAGGTSGTPELTWRVSDALALAPALKPFFAQPLDDKHQGLNIEGIAAVGGNLVLGLRAPAATKDGPARSAFLARVPVEALFAPGKGRGPAAQTVPLALGEGLGVRDLAALPDGGLLVLAGPAQEQRKPYEVWLAFDGGGAPRRLAVLADVPLPEKPKAGKLQEMAKAEAMQPLGEEDGKLRILVLFDGLENGGARTYLLSR